MPLLLLSFLVGILITILGFLLHRKLKKPAVGEILYLSLDNYDERLLKDGKVFNARGTYQKELADKAHGDTGIETIVVKRF